MALAFNEMVRNGELSAPVVILSLIHISEPTRRRGISYAVFCLKKKKRKSYAVYCLKKKKIKKKKKNIFFFFFLMIRRPPRSTPLYSSAASDVYKRQDPDSVNRTHDQLIYSQSLFQLSYVRQQANIPSSNKQGNIPSSNIPCLLYTSDAADE